MSASFEASLQSWRQAAEKTLKGADVSTLSSLSEDGIPIAPLYAGTTENAAALAPANRNFLVCPRIDLTDPAAALHQANEHLKTGCDSLVIALKGAPSQIFGIDFPDARAVSDFANGLKRKDINLRIEHGHDIEKLNAFLAAGFTHIHAGFDVIGLAASRGHFDDIDAHYATALAFIEKNNLHSAAFLADARIYHNAGASDAQDIALVLATLAENMRRFHAHGFDAVRILKTMSLQMSVDARQFAGIIKLRAMRMCYALFSQTLAGAPHPAHLSADTSLRMQSASDTPTNMIRNALAASAAILGGCDSITVLPHTLAVGLPNGFARRIAVNTLHLLREESRLADVQDAARGAPYAEEMTAALAKTAWALFQEIEKNGGILACLASGMIQGWIKQTSHARLQLYRSAEKKLVGVNAFKDPSPRETQVLQPWPEESDPQPLAVRPLRDSMPFETNRHEAAA